ncbi:MAG TPA: hypothetical protein VM582_05170, partial [Candidatus Thermoplasmatota archaeon]|nr:hypothetical protein [Candidatus Thermoplasmatota archaeon]
MLPLAFVTVLFIAMLPTQGFAGAASPTNAVVVTPSEAWMPIGGEQRFKATYFNAAGKQEPAEFTWVAEGDCRGSSQIDDTGFFVANVPERSVSCEIRAKKAQSSIVGTAMVYFTGPLARIDVAGPSSLAAGASGAYAATGYDSSGRVISVSPTWSTTCAGASIGQDGVLVAPTTSGATCLARATSGSVVGSASVAIVPAALHDVAFVAPASSLTADQTATFVAQPRDAYGNVRSDGVAYSIA